MRSLYFQRCTHISIKKKKTHKVDKKKLFKNVSPICSVTLDQNEGRKHRSITRQGKPVDQLTKNTPSTPTPTTERVITRERERDRENMVGKERIQTVNSKPMYSDRPTNRL